MHHVNHSSRARGTVRFLRTSLPLTINMNVTVGVELYYIFSKIPKLDTGNFSLALSVYIQTLTIYVNNYRPATVQFSDKCVFKVMFYS